MGKINVEGNIQFLNIFQIAISKKEDNQVEAVKKVKPRNDRKKTIFNEDLKIPEFPSFDAIGDDVKELKSTFAKNILTL